MTPPDRRTFLELLGAGAVAASLPASISKALAVPANNVTGTIRDVEHIVILMQENRAFDHYFGTLSGVRGYRDPRAVKLTTGKSVWYQPDGAGYVLPFHPTAPHLGLQFLEDLAHDWTSTHYAWNGGQYDQWVPAKSTTTMAYLTRHDIPFHYALADAFTICDAYHCSLLGPTDPNRYHMFTGWVGNNGNGTPPGGPVIDNAEAGYNWSTYPEKLQNAGITWKVYQDVGLGLTAANYWGWTSDAYIGNYGDNSLLYFLQYQNAPSTSPLAQRARTGTNIAAGGTLFDIFRSDVENGTLPQVSYIVAPEAYTEHPNWPANYGAWYVSQFLDILASNPKVWSKTALFLTYDENDGFFDHVVPPTPPMPGLAHQGISTVSTENEIFTGNSQYPAAEYPPGPYGLGVRVPMIVISPWSKGGWVSSQVFDHTSIIRFIEQRFGPTNPKLVEQNITPWRRAVTGDLTSAFDFKTPNQQVVYLPPTNSYIPPDDARHPDYVPLVPLVQSLPKQEPGLRNARPVPYQVAVSGHVYFATGTFHMTLRNTGAQAAWVQVRSPNPLVPPRGYTIGAGHEVSDAWPVLALGGTTYDLAVYGPNGFFRHYKGSIGGPLSANLLVTSSYDVAKEAVTVVVTNQAAAKARVSVHNKYNGATSTQTLQSGEAMTVYTPAASVYGWYDLVVTDSYDASFTTELAGHIETGRASATDPMINAMNANAI